MSSIQSFPKRCTSISLCIAVGLNFISLSLSAQSPQLTTATHMPMASDSLVTYQIPNRAVTDSGDNCVWDFSMVADTLERNIEYYCFHHQDSTIYGVHHMGTRNYYQYLHDTILMLGYENATAQMCYTTPELCLIKPLQLGQRFTSDFAGVGEYGHTIPTRMHGFSEVTIDARGILLLPSVQIDSVLRIHTKKTLHEHRFDSVHIVIDSYHWMSSLYPYPLVELVQVQSKTTKDTIATRYAFYLPLDSSRLQVPANRKPMVEESETNANLYISSAAFAPNPVKDMLQVSYHLTRTANVWLSLHNSSGFQMMRIPCKQLEVGKYQHDIDMAGYPVGAYVLYIHADDTVIAETIIKNEL